MENSTNQHSSTNSAQFAEFAWAKILSNQVSENETENSPFIPASVYTELPDLLKNGCSVFSNEREKDVFLTGAITVLSGCFSNVSGIYDKYEVYPNLFCFIVAPAASGKGVLTHAKALGLQIHRQLLKETDEAKKTYQTEIKKHYAESKKNKSAASLEPPKVPPTKLLFIPANSSTANVIKLLEENNGSAIICETEADTMVNSFKQDWGGYSDLLRKAFHHEAITYSRKTNSEYIEVTAPKLSVALSGTPSQVKGLILSNEDGLFSRFLFYDYKTPNVWRDVSYRDGINYDAHFKPLSEQVYKIHEDLKNKKIEFMLSPAQWEIINKYGNSCSALMDDEMRSTIRRTGLIVYRIAMVLTVLRQANNLCTYCQMFCNDADIKTACALADVYLAHDLLAYKLLLSSGGKKINSFKMKFFEALPAVGFEKKEAINIGAELSIKERTVANYLNELLDNGMLEKVRFGGYKKK